jgi:PAS domain S-box-containing protein
MVAPNQPERRQDIRLVVDAMPTLAWSARPDGSAVFFNRRWLDYTGLSPEQALDAGWKLAVHPDDLPRVIGVFEEARTRSQPFEVEGRFRRFDGAYRWFLFRGSPLCDQVGTVIQWYGTNTDLEDRKRAEDALRASEHELRVMIDSLPGLIATMDAAGEVEFVNQPVSDFFGKTAQELRNWASFIHPDDLDQVVARWRRSIETGVPYETVHRQRGVHGYRWFNVRGLPVRGAEGHILRWYFLLTDVEDQKRAEEALRADIEARKQVEARLRENEAHLLEMQALTRTGSWRLNTASGKVTVSPEVLRCYGVGPEEDTSDVEFWFDRIHPDDRSRVRELFDRCMALKTDYEADYRIQLPDGTVKHQHAISHPVLNEAGELVEFVGTTMEVTEQVRAREKLERAMVEIGSLKDQLQKENVALRDEVDRVSMFEEIVGTSRALQAVLSRVARVAPTDSTVLISGETGTGKELVARAIHKRSPRAPRAFISVNSAALAPSLIGSELFGHEKGAFTGAVQRRLGRFELANGGTIFLDEVGDLPPDTQTALLRVLQEREFERVGGQEAIKVDVRVIAATNRELRAAQADGSLRSDLYYRLNVVPIEVPPLRERREDVRVLLEYFVHRFGRQTGKAFRRIDPRTLELFEAYDWPGNIRELQNVVERSVILSVDETFRVDEAWLSRAGDRARREPVSAAADPDAGDEQRLIEAALAESRGRVSGPRGAAARLGVPPSTLEYRIKKLKIRKSRFRLG